MNLIEECQAEIEKYSPIEHYKTSYRKEEVGYWEHIPGWLIDDSRKRDIKTVLDIGCAYGTLMLFSKKLFGEASSVFGLDMIKAYWPKELEVLYGLQWSLCNIELAPIPFPSALKFDVILMTAMLEHLNFEATPTLLKVKDALSENGKLYLSTPDAGVYGVTRKYYSSYSEVPRLPWDGKKALIDDHIWQFNKKELMELFGGAGLKVEKLGYSPARTATHFNVVLTKQ